MFYYHRASAWGISILDDNLITGSMDGTIGVIDLKRMKLVKHFKAHDDEWGGEYILTQNSRHMSQNVNALIFNVLQYQTWPLAVTSLLVVALDDALKSGRFPSAV